MTKRTIELPPMQRRIFIYIKEYVEKHNYAPSVRDICNEVKLTSTSTVHGHLKRLEEKGFIRRGTGKSRAIEITDDDRKARARSLTVPLIGEVTSDISIYSEDNIYEFLSMPKYIVADEHSFALKTKDESMINAGINYGDIIVVKEQNYAFDGDIIVALIEDNQATTKKYYLDGKKIRLQPENDLLDSIVLPVDQVNILGKVTALIRRIQ